MTTVVPLSSTGVTSVSEQLPHVENGVPTVTIADLSKLNLQDELEDNSNVPSLSIPHIFWLFFTKFGIFAWGGPVAQIALIKEKLVIKEKWYASIAFSQCTRSFPVLRLQSCMFLGYLAGGRLGGLAAGLGFILPGFVLMLAASYLYVVVGFGNKYVDASFRALQPMVAAMVCRRSHPSVFDNVEILFIADPPSHTQDL